MTKSSKDERLNWSKVSK